MNAVGAEQTLLAFDYGKKRVGVAVGNTVSNTAQPLFTIEYARKQELFDRIEALILEWAPNGFVVGLPLDEEGQPLPVTDAAERFARRLSGRFHLPVTMTDERYTSVAAQSELAAMPSSERRAMAKMGGLGPGEADDAMAAAIILRQYLNG